MVNTLVQQPLDMTVHELSRVADGIAGDGVLPHAINALILDGTGHNLKAQMIEQPLPKGQQLVHIEAHGNAHHAALGRIEVRQSLEQLQLLAIQIKVVLWRHMRNGALAAIATDEALATSENVDC